MKFAVKIIAHQFYSAFRIKDYGYTRMTVYNATHLHIEQVSEDKVSYQFYFISSFALLPFLKVFFYFI
jgi:hypothetical protein